mgnify:CR=1 FL=1
MFDEINIPLIWWMILAAVGVVSLLIIAHNFKLASKIRSKHVVTVLAVVSCMGLLWLYSSYSEFEKAPTTTSTVAEVTDDDVVRISDFPFSEIFQISTWTDLRVLVILFGAIAICVLLFVGRTEEGKLQVRMPKLNDVWRGSFAAATAAIAFNMIWAGGELSGNVDTFTRFALHWAYVCALLVIIVIIWPLAKDKEWAQRWTGTTLVIVGIILMLHIGVYRKFEDLPRPVHYTVDVYNDPCVATPKFVTWMTGWCEKKPIRLATTRIARNFLVMDVSPRGGQVHLKLDAKTPRAKVPYQMPFNQNVVRGSCRIYHYSKAGIPVKFERPRRSGNVVTYYDAKHDDPEINYYVDYWGYLIVEPTGSDGCETLLNFMPRR